MQKSITIILLLIVNLALAQMDAPPIGIAWANLAGQAVAVVCMTVLAQRVHPVPYPLVSGAIVLLAAIPLCTLGARAGGPLTALQLAGALVAVTIGFFAWLWFAVMDPRDRRRALQIIASRAGGTR